MWKRNFRLVLFLILISMVSVSIVGCSSEKEITTKNISSPEEIKQLETVRELEKFIAAKEAELRNMVQMMKNAPVEKARETTPIKEEQMKKISDSMKEAERDLKRLQEEAKKKKHN